jgi:hypothetical protein
MGKPDFGMLVSLGTKNYVHFRLDILCPHCGYFSFAEGPQVGTNSVAVKCHRCSKPIMIQYTGNALASATSDRIADYYPKRTVAVDKFVPSEIATDYLEAQRCFSVGAWQACAVMARRCMHHIMSRESAEGKDLYQQINNLREKRVITPTLAEAAQRIRVIGNHGAHPYDFKGDTLEQLGMEDARDALEFCEWVFDQIYIQPSKIQASKNRPKPEKA